MNNTLYRGILFLFSGSLLASSSCKKTYEFEVSGKVYNKNTNEPIEGVEVYLYDGMYGSDPLFGEGSGSEKIDVDTTDANGIYNISIKTSSGWVAVTASKQGYHFDDENTAVDLGYIKVHKGINEKDLKMEGVSSFDGVFYKSSFSQKENDVLRFSVISYDSFQKEGTYSNYDLPAIGYQSLSEEGFSPPQVKGDRYLRYKLEWTNNGVWQSKIDSVYLPTSLEVYRDTIYY